MDMEGGKRHHICSLSILDLSIRCHNLRTLLPNGTDLPIPTNRTSLHQVITKYIFLFVQYIYVL
jgi:hypothetical protein